ncbi:MBL fold metallo-hydrolase [Alicyclobacillus fodiniaquatilis]|uniref:MBL fold metallo-hydrolase n=1 Tax=Alicyclobacillus fodiniaquatilis TaxID=1661150 RepID=A0ABW4JEC2_9BACL
MEIQKGVHLLESTKGSFVYLVLDRNEPLLIDTGNPGKHEKIEAELAKLGVSLNDIAHILLTHSDVDHIGNAKSLQRASGAKVWAPQDDLPYIHGTKKHKGLRRLIGAVVKAEKPEVDATYEPGQHVGSVEMIPTPGHTPGHVSFRYGDILFYRRFGHDQQREDQTSAQLFDSRQSQLEKIIARCGQAIV